jgi:hypothetical protein
VAESYDTFGQVRHHGIGKGTATYNSAAQPVVFQRLPFLTYAAHLHFKLGRTRDLVIRPRRSPSIWPLVRGNVEAVDLLERGISIGSELRCYGHSTRRLVTYQDEKKRSSSSVVFSKAVLLSGAGGG